MTLVDCAAYQLWKPRLHEVAAGLLGAGEDETSYLALARANHYRFRLGAMVGLDPLEQAVRVSDGAHNRLSVGIVGAGATGMELAAPPRYPRDRSFRRSDVRRAT